MKAINSNVRAEDIEDAVPVKLRVYYSVTAAAGLRPVLDEMWEELETAKQMQFATYPPHKLIPFGELSPKSLQIKILQGWKFLINELSDKKYIVLRKLIQVCSTSKGIQLEWKRNLKSLALSKEIGYEAKDLSFVPAMRSHAEILENLYSELDVWLGHLDAKELASGELFERSNLKLSDEERIHLKQKLEAYSDRLAVVVDTNNVLLAVA